MQTYTTVQGDTFDSIAYDLYGSEKYMRFLAEANWPHLDILIFPSGVVLNVPDIPDDIPENVPFWRKA